MIISKEEQQKIIEIIPKEEQEQQKIIEFFKTNIIDEESKIDDNDKKKISTYLNNPNDETTTDILDLLITKRKELIKKRKDETEEPIKIDDTIDQYHYAIKQIAREYKQYISLDMYKKVLPFIKNDSITHRYIIKNILDENKDITLDSFMSMTNGGKELDFYLKKIKDLKELDDYLKKNKINEDQGALTVAALLALKYNVPENHEFYIKINDNIEIPESKKNIPKILKVVGDGHYYIDLQVSLKNIEYILRVDSAFIYKDKENEKEIINILPQFEQQEDQIKKTIQFQHTYYECSLMGIKVGKILSEIPNDKFEEYIDKKNKTLKWDLIDKEYPHILPHILTFCQSQTYVSKLCEKYNIDHTELLNRVFIKHHPFKENSNKTYNLSSYWKSTTKEEKNTNEKATNQRVKALLTNEKATNQRVKALLYLKNGNTKDAKQETKITTTIHKYFF